MFDSYTKTILIECLNGNIRRELLENASGATGSAPPTTGGAGTTTTPTATTTNTTPSNALAGSNQGPSASPTTLPFDKGGSVKTGFGAAPGFAKASKGNVLGTGIIAGDNATLAGALGMGAAGAALGSVKGLGNIASQFVGGNAGKWLGGLSNNSALSSALGGFGEFLGVGAGEAVNALQKSASDVMGGKRALKMIGNIGTTSSNIVGSAMGATRPGSWAQQLTNQPDEPQKVERASDIASRKAQEAEDAEMSELEKKVRKAELAQKAKNLGISP